MKLSIYLHAAALSAFLLCGAGSVQAQSNPGTQPFKNANTSNVNGPPRNGSAGTDMSSPLNINDLRRQNNANAASQAIKMGDQFRHATPADYDSALMWYEYALSRDAKAERAYLGIGETYRLSNRPAEAVGAYEQALTLKPKMVEAQVGLGWTYYNQKLFDKAMQSFETAIALKPKTAEAHLGIASCHVAQKRYGDAVTSFLKVIELKPKLPEARYNLAVTYLLMDNREAAVEQQRLLTSINKAVADKLGNVIANYYAPQK